MPKLIKDWKLLVRKAWSFRLNLIGLAVCAADVAVQYVAPTRPSVGFTLLVAGLNLAAGVARLMQQPKLTEARDGKQ